LPPEDVPTENLLENLTPEQRRLLEKILLTNKKAFGLDGRLGHYPAKVEIPLR
ncbi:hypothetical protein M422DRAFT_188142, partial [Sphaerobolus stellatus SS14]